MDGGDPRNFARIIDLYKNSHEDIKSEISAVTYDDKQIADAVNQVYKKDGYLLDPHGACGFLALEELLQPGEKGIFLETAHPAKFKDTVEPIIKEEVAIPENLQGFMKGVKDTVELSGKYDEFKKFLLNNK